LDFIARFAEEEEEAPTEVDDHFYSLKRLKVPDPASKYRYQRLWEVTDHITQHLERELKVLV
jgi:hypothetical protein